MSKWMFDKLTYSDDFKKDLEVEKLAMLSDIFIAKCVAIDARGGIFSQAHVSDTILKLSDQPHFSALTGV